MTDSFNGYHVWLGIPPSEQPPNHYRLLGIGIFETDVDVIDHAADRQMAHVRTFQSGPHKGLSQQILNELAAARVCLLNAQRKKSYDDELREKLAAASKVAIAVPKAVPVAATAPRVVPQAVPAALAPQAANAPEAIPVDDMADDVDSYEVEDVDRTIPARRATGFDDEIEVESLDSPGARGKSAAALAPAIQVRKALRPANSDAAIQKAMVYVFAAVVVIVVGMLLYGLLRRAVAPNGWHELFAAPTPAVETEIEHTPKHKAPPPPTPVKAVES
jgi:hypothetical protein